MSKIDLPAGLEVHEPSERHRGSILIADAASNDIAEFFHAEHATVPQSYEAALLLARMSAAAPDLVEALENGVALISGDATGIEWKRDCQAFLLEARAALSRAIGKEG